MRGVPLGLGMLAVLALGGCSEDACIRNSECPRGYQCTAAVCTLRPGIDGGPDAGPASDGGAVDAGVVDAGPTDGGAD